MKDPQPQNPELDEGWDDEALPPRPSSAAPASQNDVQLAAVDDGWGADDEAPASVEAAVDEGWDLGDESASTSGSTAASDARTGGAARKAGARRGPRRAGQVPVVEAQRTLSKKERRALERKQRLLATQRTNERKQTEKVEREQRRRTEQASLAEQKAAEQKAAQERAAAQKAAQQKSAKEQAAAQKAAQKQAAAQKRERASELAETDDAAPARPRKKSREGKSNALEKPLAQKSRASAISLGPLMLGVAVLLLAVFLIWLRR